MPRTNALVDTVANTVVQAQAAPAAHAENYLDIAFSGGRTARVDLREPRAKGWTGALAELREAGLDVYVEIDPGTGLVTEVLVPIPDTVSELIPGQDRVEVVLTTAHAIHHLRRDNPDYEELLDLLESSRAARTPALITSDDNHAIVDVRPAPKAAAERLAEPEAGPVPEALGTPVTYAQVAQMYQLAASRTACSANPTAPGIPFTYPDDGCWARAHEMARLMIAAGITPDKIWNYASAGRRLRVSSANKPDCVVEWGWHVAPTLVAGGVTYVIDPALFGGPVTQDTWRSVQGDPASRLEPTGWDVYHNHSTPRFDPTYSNTNHYLAVYRAQLQLRSNTPAGPPPYANCQPITPGVQWRGSIAAGTTARWFTHSWNAHRHMIWTVMPTSVCPGGPQLRYDVAVQRTDANLCTYWITVQNLTGSTVKFEGRYHYLT